MNFKDGLSSVLGLETIWTPSAIPRPGGSSLACAWDRQWGIFREGLVLWPTIDEMRHEGEERIAEDTRRGGQRRPEPTSRKEYLRFLPLLRLWDCQEAIDCAYWKDINLIVEPKPLDATWGSWSRIPDFEGCYFPVDEIPEHDVAMLVNSELMDAIVNPGVHPSVRGFPQLPAHLEAAIWQIEPSPSVRGFSQLQAHVGVAILQDGSQPFMQEFRHRPADIEATIMQTEPHPSVRRYQQPLTHIEATISQTGPHLSSLAWPTPKETQKEKRQRRKKPRPQPTPPLSNYKYLKPTAPTWTPSHQSSSRITWRMQPYQQRSAELKITIST